MQTFRTQKLKNLLSSLCGLAILSMVLLLPAQVFARSISDDYATIIRSLADQVPDETFEAALAEAQSSNAGNLRTFALAFSVAFKSIAPQDVFLDDFFETARPDVNGLVAIMTSAGGQGLASNTWGWSFESGRYLANLNITTTHSAKAYFLSAIAKKHWLKIVTINTSAATKSQDNTSLNTAKPRAP